MSQPNNSISRRKIRAYAKELGIEVSHCRWGWTFHDPITGLGTPFMVWLTDQEMIGQIQRIAERRVVAEFENAVAAYGAQQSDKANWPTEGF